MRYFAILVVLSCLLALCSAYRKVTLKNEAGEKETYESDDRYCHRVGRKYHGKKNHARVSGGVVAYFSDSECKQWLEIDYATTKEYRTIKSPIKAYRAL
ncbi:hypothetical protein GGF42_008228, partial [Coemansia sp. RSA 2424]